MSRQNIGHKSIGRRLREGRTGEGGWTIRSKIGKVRARGRGVVARRLAAADIGARLNK
jgi:hypothetical protein